MALRILAESLLCGLPIFFLFLSLYQISSWKINMFRWGIVIFTFSEPFPAKISKHLTNRVIEYKGLTFNFVSQKLGLFQSKIGRLRINSPTMTSVFPLLGEIVLGEAGDAKIILRVPNSIILLFVCTVISVSSLIVLSKDIKADFLSTVIGICLISFPVVFLFYAEKLQLKNGIQLIKEYVIENV
jgi:hypothetical protein